MTEMLFRQDPYARESIGTVVAQTPEGGIVLDATIFYPTVIILAIMGATPLDVTLAWIYVGARIVHSIYQSTVNVVKVRLLIFLVATISLVVLAVRAIMATLLHDPGVLA